MNGQAESVLDATEWIEEAEAQMRDIKNQIKSFRISPVLSSDNSGVFINITTLENLKYCVKLSTAGFQVVAEKHDSIEGTSKYAENNFETPFALLSCISPSFTSSFAASLSDSLSKLEQKQ